ncbi:chitooligosaccharide deacetylase NodB [Phytohabitans flavus]|uniref:Chitooligosaccharide deacetylase NodB n=1 Tax=Phytohabitans flavus TaxID=1076124 RepID=A0A6F8XNQ2_9ACTN|nr:polysaccharide deacetylase family protein [Phytohabitans flavus]BCB75381.1 chitooligosaccharide deacetylase NodB [Phytohabitans flavus]
MTRPLPYLWARSLEALLLGVRAHRRRRPFTPGRRAWPLFNAETGAVALTVDDGPDPRWTPALLDVLARHEVPATFFLIGARTAEQPRLARRIAEAGHAIGNHSMHHPQPFAALDAARQRAEIGETQERIADAVGQPPRLFRAPGGGWSRTVLGVAAEHGLTAVDWTVNPSDWKEPGVPHITRVLSRSGPGHILLCHDGGGDRSQTIAALDRVIPLLKERGLRFVPVPARDAAVA